VFLLLMYTRYMLAILLDLIVRTLVLRLAVFRAPTDEGGLLKLLRLDGHAAIWRTRTARSMLESPEATIKIEVMSRIARWAGYEEVGEERGCARGRTATLRTGYAG
jgi:hypothetical protein